MTALRRVLLGGLRRRPRAARSRCRETALDPASRCSGSGASAIPGPARAQRAGRSGSPCSPSARRPSSRRSLSGHAGGEPRPPAKGLLLVAALYVTADALEDARGRRTASSPGSRWPPPVAAVVGLLQVAACARARAAGDGLARWLYHRCDRARGFFSIYMTLAGVLTLVLLATLPRLLPGARAAPGRRRPGSSRSAASSRPTRAGPGSGFAAGVLALPAHRAGAAAGSCWRASSCCSGCAPGGPRELRHRVPQHGRSRGVGRSRSASTCGGAGSRCGASGRCSGSGPGGVKREYSRYALPEAVKKRTGHVHNTPLQILVERGVLGPGRVALDLGRLLRAQAIGLLRRLVRGRARERALVVGQPGRDRRASSSAASPSTTSATPRSSWSPGPSMALPWVGREARRRGRGPERGGRLGRERLRLRRVGRARRPASRPRTARSTSAP